MRDSMVFTRVGLDGCLDFIRTAPVVRIVAMGFKPAAFIVSPDSVHTRWLVESGV